MSQESIEYVNNPRDFWHLRHWLQFCQFNGEPKFMTKIVICQLRVTLDRIRNSWDVYTNTLFLSMLGHSFDICIFEHIF